MATFFLLLYKIVPLYVLIGLGYLAGKKLNVKKETVAAVLVYIIAPVVVFHGTFKAELSLITLSLPVVFFVICSVLGLIFYLIGKRMWNDSTPNILGFMAGAGNTGYFGLPVVLSVLGNNTLSSAVFATLGVIFFENSLGFYLVAKGNHTGRESVKKLLRLPALYAFVFGVMANFAFSGLGSAYEEMAINFKAAYTILGMMIVGLGLVGMSRMKFDFKLLSISLIAKFLAWPIIVALIIFMDMRYLHLYDEFIYKVMIIMSAVPLAANSVSFASLLKVYPEKAASAVFVSTAFALIYIPIVVMFAFTWI